MGGLTKYTDKVSNNLALLSDRNQGVLSHPEVINGLTPIEAKVTQSSLVSDSISRTPIRSLSKEELSSEIMKTLKLIIRNLGIKNWGSDQHEATYDGMKFMQFLQSYHYDLTYKEVELAFDLLMVGSLDEYLPIGSNGQPDRNHYQSFSTDFYSKVLRAYKKYKSKVWSKANGLVPELKELPSEEELNEAKRMMFQNLIEVFDYYCETGELSNHMVAFIVFKLLRNRNLITEDIEITEADRRTALATLLANTFRTEYDRDKIKTDFKEKNGNSEIDSFAKTKAFRRAIKGAFDKLIENKEHVSKYLTHE